MMKTILRIGTLLLFCLGLYHTAEAQVLAVTKEGQRVILYGDGTWKFESEIDSINQTATPVEAAPVIVEKPKPKPRVYSLECPDLVDVEKDISSDARISVSRSLVILKEDSTKAFSVSMTKTKKSSLMWMTKIVGSPCITSNSSMILVMSDGTRFILTTDSKPNCNGLFQLNFGNLDGKDDVLASMKVNQIASLRIILAKGFVEGSFDEENARKFKAAVNCIYAK